MIEITDFDNGTGDQQAVPTSSWCTNPCACDDSCASADSMERGENDNTNSDTN